MTNKTIQINLQGASRITCDVTSHIDELEDKLETAIPVLLEEIGLHLEGEAKDELENTPRRVDTGLLRNSITHAIGGQGTAIKNYRGDTHSQYNPQAPIPTGSYHGTMPRDKDGEYTVYIGTNVDYAAYVHEGTTGAHSMPPNHYLKNAVDRNTGQIKQKITERLNAAVG